MRHGRNVLIRVFELRSVARAGGEERPGEGAEGGEEEEDGGVGDGFRARGGRVAVEDAVGGERAGVDPVEAGAGAGVDSAGGGEEGSGAGGSQMVRMGVGGGENRVLRGERGMVREMVSMDVHELFIPVSHLPSCVPERSVHPYEIAPSALSQRGFEVFPAHGVRSLDVEFGS